MIVIARDKPALYFWADDARGEIQEDKCNIA